MSETNELELKPCPFCGGEAELKIDDRTQDDTYDISCVSCGNGTTYNFYDKCEACDTWNRRTPAVPQWTMELPKAEGWYRVLYSGKHVDCISIELCKIRPDIYGLGTYLDTERDFDDRYKFYTLEKYVDKFGVLGWCKIVFPPLPQGEENMK